MLLRRTLAQLMAAAALLPAGLSAQARRPLTRIAFGSCAEQADSQPIWDAILAYKPELFIFGGDNVYGDFNTADAGPLRKAYATADAIAGYNKLRDSVSHLVVWDDHDYGINDGGGDFPHKAVSKDLFLDFWKVPASDVRRTREGIYDSHIIGPPGMRVQIILLDMRWFRSPLKLTDQRGAPGKERYLPDPDPTKTMLGETQWAWLADELRKPAELRLLVSSIQVLAEGHGWERWGNFPLERARLLKLLSRANGVVLLSGDRHIGAIYRESEGLPYPLYEATASGFTHPWAGASEPGPNRLGDLFTEQHYGTVDIDWRASQVQLALRDAKGVVRRSQLLNLDQMKVPA